MGFYLSEHKMYEDECIVSKTKHSGEIWQCRIWVSEDKAISDEEKEHIVFKKHFKLQQLRRSNYLIKNGIEKAQDNLGVCN